MPSATHPETVPPSPEVILSTHDLTKRFDDFVAVDGLNLRLHRGEILGLLGVNGAGKTTVINMVLGLTTPSAGRVELFGQSLERHRVEVLRRMNFSSAYASLPTNLLVWQNLTVFAGLYGVHDSQRRIDELLQLFEIPHLRKKVTGQLSAGESTRVNLIKSLLNNPELLVLDEPTASLDPDIADKVRRILRGVRERTGMGVLYTSHNMRDIEEVCDRVMFIHHGRLLCAGTPQDIVAQSKSPSLEALFIRLARERTPESP